MSKAKNTVLIRSERLYLSPLLPYHAGALTKWFNDPAIFAHQREMNWMITIEQQRAWIEKINKDPTQRNFAIYYIPEDELIGYSSLIDMNPQDGTAEVGLAIGETQYQGKGLGAEALWLTCKYGFEELQLSNIMGENIDNNPIAIANAEKIGLKRYGTRRLAKKIGEKFYDVHYSDMLPHELIKPEIKKK